MANISYFQRYSQRENHVTNNTLLVMRHFYQVSPQKISGVLTELCGEELSVGLQFKQQVKLDTSVPDARISQAPLDIYFETKRGAELDLPQIDRHLDSINGNTRNHARKFLFGLTTVKMDNVDRVRIEKRVKEKGNRVIFVPITFADILRSLREHCEHHETTLREILDDYQNFLESEDLLPSKTLMAVAVGGTFRVNVDHKLYWRKASENEIKADFIGLYRNKCIEAIASINKVVVIGGDSDDVVVRSGQPSSEESKRIKRAMAVYPNLKEREHRYYLFGELHSTRFVKRSKGGLISRKKFSLSSWQKDYEHMKEYSAQEVAESLKQEEW